MKPYLTKALEIAGKAIELARRAGTKLLDLGRWLSERMRSVEIDQPRGVILCLALQFAILLTLIAFKPGSPETELPSLSETGRPAPSAEPPAIEEPAPDGVTNSNLES